jgi:hypothetical protein
VVACLFIAIGDDGDRAILVHHQFRPVGQQDMRAGMDRHAVDGGDEQQNATNYGLVQITNKANNHISYARSFDFSNTSIGTNAPSSLKFTVESSIENGPSSLRVIASGFASAPIDVSISGGTALPITAAPKKQRTDSRVQIRRMYAVIAIE